MKIQVDRAGGIGENQAPNPAPVQLADSEDHLGRGIALVKMRGWRARSPRQSRCSSDHLSSVADGGRRRPSCYFGVGSLKAVFEDIGECAQTASEYNADLVFAHIVFVHDVYAHSKTPAMQADMKLAMVPAAIAFIPSLARSDRREGASAPIPPTCMATELRLAKPHSA